ncbi:MAG: hypothetical protein V4487_02290 [Chlamydiota bacterium]
MLKKFAPLLLALVVAVKIGAAPVGNTAAPKLIEEGIWTCPNSWIDLRVGYEGDFVTNGRMEQFEESHGPVDSYTQNTNSGTVTINLIDRIDFYGVFGSSKTWGDWRFIDELDSVHRIKMKTDSHFLLGLGGRGILFEWGRACLGFGGRYSSVDYKLASLSSDGVKALASEACYRWKHWQVNLDISYTIDLLTPYLGGKYSYARGEVGPVSIPISANGSGTNHFKLRSPFGFYLGCSVSARKYFMLNLEARLVDEEAITVSGDFRF